MMASTKAKLVDLSGRDEPDKLLAALDEMQLVFFETFQHRPEFFLDSHHWNVCKKLWRQRYSDDPIEKSAAIEWRKPDGKNPIAGQNKARKHLDIMIEDGFLRTETRNRVIFIYPTEKFCKCFEKILVSGVQAVKRELSLPS